MSESEPKAAFRKLLQSGARSQTLVTEADLTAGERFCFDYLRSNALPQTTANWSPVTDTGPRSGSGATSHRANAHAERIDRAVQSRQRLSRAIAVIGERNSHLLLDAGCHCLAICELERRYGLPQRSGKVAIAFALRPLAIHYGLATRGP